MAAVAGTSELLELGRKLRLRGALDEAAKCFRQVLEHQPQDTDALRELGTVCLLQGRHQEALGLLESALQVRPKDFDALMAKCSALVALKHFGKALTGFEEALKIQPNSAEAHNNRGGALGKLGRHAEALASFEKAIALKPNYVDAHKNRSAALRALGRRDEAPKNSETTSAPSPDDPVALLNRAKELRTLKRDQEALLWINKALSVRPDLLDAYIKRGEVLENLYQREEALASFTQALAIDPQSARLHVRCGALLRKMGRYDDALVSFEKALLIEPELPSALIGHARTFMDLQRPDQALRAYERVIEFSSDSPEALVSYGFALARTGHYEKAVENYRRALLFQPDRAWAHENLGFSLLVMGELQAGFTELEWRWKRQLRGNLRRFAQPRWVGQVPVEGKTIFLYPEQGFGDTLQMLRYVPLLAEAGARVVLEVQAPLVQLLQGLTGAEHVVGPGTPLPPFDLHCPLMSLPLACRTTLDNIPASVPYVPVPVERISTWQKRLGPAKAPRIGLCWSGNPQHKGDRNRSISVKQFLPLLSLGVEVICLQKDLRDVDRDILIANSQIRDFGGVISDFADTAALISFLDLVISVDTAPAHLAGALGKPVWVLLPIAPDWRWLLDREDSPWYPTARLFRQSRMGDWDAVIHRVLKELPKQFASGERSGTGARKPVRASQKKCSSARRGNSGRKKA